MLLNTVILYHRIQYYMLFQFRGNLRPQALQHVICFYPDPLLNTDNQPKEENPSNQIKTDMDGLNRLMKNSPSPFRISRKNTNQNNNKFKLTRFYTLPCSTVNHQNASHETILQKNVTCPSAVSSMKMPS